MNTFKTICFRCILTIGAMMLLIAPASAQNILELVSQAEQGDAQAQYHLGRYYYSGQGVTQSYDRAVAWWQKAAMQGVADAQCNLGVCYKSYNVAVGELTGQTACKRWDGDTHSHLRAVKVHEDIRRTVSAVAYL